MNAKRWRRRVKFRLLRRYREVRADTVLISFPKCGRTWLRLMMGEALDAHFGLNATGPEKLELERLGAKRRGVPRILVTHAFDHLADNSVAVPRPPSRYRRKKVILLVRDPRDVVVSLYFQVKKRTRAGRQPYGGSVGDFLREPDLSLTTLLAFYNSWAEARELPRTLHLVRYEDLHRDPVGELRRVVQFLGIHEVKADVLAGAVAATTFDEMRGLERTDALASRKMRAGEASDEESFKTRRGQVGGYTDYLAASDVAWLETQVAGLDPWFGYEAP